jgi:hypothetical protein
VRNEAAGIARERGREAGARPEAVSWSRGGFGSEGPTVEDSTVEAERL